MKTAEETETFPAWMGYRSAARYCGLGKSTLTKLVTSGKVQASRPCGKVLISRRSLDEFLEAHAYTKSE